MLKFICIKRINFSVYKTYVNIRFSSRILTIKIDSFTSKKIIETSYCKFVGNNSRLGNKIMRGKKNQKIYIKGM